MALKVATYDIYMLMEAHLVCTDGFAARCEVLTDDNFRKVSTTKMREISRANISWMNLVKLRTKKLPSKATSSVATTVIHIPHHTRNEMKSSPMLEQI